MLVDLSDTLFFRDYATKDERREVFKQRAELMLKGRPHYFRPGYEDFIQRIQHHPRSVFAIYSSITGQNLFPIMDAMLKTVKLDTKKEKLQALGQEFCTKMIDHP